MGVFAGPEITESGLVLALDAANKKSYSQNEFQYSTDIVTFSGTGANAATITRDTTISSPVGNTPLKMVVTGNDPYVIGMYNTPSKNIAPAANGQTWIVSVYIKASVATTGAIFIFGAAADGNVFDAVTGQISTGGVSIGTDWTRVSYAFTFTKNISFIQVRLDGPDAGGTGQTIWWDGLQVERVPSGTTTPTPFTSSYYGGSVYRDLVGSNNGTLVNYPTYSGSNSGSLVFDGVDDNVTGTLPLIPLNSSVTIETVVKLNNTTGTKNIFTQGQHVVSFSCGMVIVGTNMRFRNSNNDHTLSSPQTLASNQWYHLVLSTDTNGTTGYVNAVSIGTTTQKVTSNSVTDYFIGKRPTVSSEYVNGNIAKLSIYNRALTAAEIQQNFNATRSRFSI